jgi:hypothetical protein
MAIATEVLPWTNICLQWRLECVIECVIRLLLQVRVGIYLVVPLHAILTFE